MGFTSCMELRQGPVQLERSLQATAAGAVTERSLQAAAAGGRHAGAPAPTPPGRARHDLPAGLALDQALQHLHYVGELGALGGVRRPALLDQLLGLLQGMTGTSARQRGRSFLQELNAAAMCRASLLLASGAAQAASARTTPRGLLVAPGSADHRQPAMVQRQPRMQRRRKHLRSHMGAPELSYLHHRVLVVEPLELGPLVLHGGRLAGADWILPGKGRVVLEQLVQDHGEAVHVHAGVVWLMPEHLGRLQSGSRLQPMLHALVASAWGGLWLPDTAPGRMMASWGVSNGRMVLSCRCCNQAGAHHVPVAASLASELEGLVQVVLRMLVVRQ